MVPVLKSTVALFTVHSSYFSFKFLKRNINDDTQMMSDDF